MQCRLIVLRHAKSAWNTAAASDHARPLNKRGRRDAPQVAAHLLAAGWCPQQVVLSDAARTRETWARMAPTLGEDVVSVLAPALYHGGLAEVRSALRGLGEDATTVMVIGHNPGWEDMVSSLVGREVMMTTCNAALLTLEADDWAAALAARGAWRLASLVRPKEL